jgi:hypothetical protein
VNFAANIRRISCGLVRHLSLRWYFMKCIFVYNLMRNSMFQDELRTTKVLKEVANIYIKLSACRNQENSLALLLVKTLPAISITWSRQGNHHTTTEWKTSTAVAITQGCKGFCWMCDLVIAPLASNSYRKCMCVIIVPVLLTITLYEVYIYYFMCVRWGSQFHVVNRLWAA